MAPRHVLSVVVIMILASVVATFGGDGSYPLTERIFPHVPIGAKLPWILPRPTPDPDTFAKVEGGITLAVFFRMEKGLDLNWKAFRTDPQAPTRLWEMASLTAQQLATAKLPIRGSLRTGEGMITDPLILKPGTLNLITLVVDNRMGVQDQQFFVAGPHPKTEFFLSEDTDPSILLKVTPVCLCQSVVYIVPKAGIWYRVVGFYVGKDAPTPSRVVFGMTALKAPRAKDQ
ncbi:MAG: hypothetical protein ACE5MM_08695 [Nitrospiraceae bacterium]